MNDVQKEILIGLMLGDGFLTKHGKNARLGIKRSIKDKSYIEYHSYIFNDYSAKINDYIQHDNRTNKNYFSVYLHTKTHVDFTIQYEKWYPNGKKIIPKDIVLTPRILATWFADDGSIMINPGCRIELATHGFSLNEVKFLQQKLRLFQLYPKIYLTKSGPTMLFTSKNQVKLFTNIIDPVFPESMVRKSLVWNSVEFNSIISKPRIKLFTKEKVKQLWKTGKYSRKYLCDKFSISKSTMQRIVSNGI